VEKGKRVGHPGEKKLRTEDQSLKERIPVGLIEYVPIERTIFSNKRRRYRLHSLHLGDTTFLEERCGEGFDGELSGENITFFRFSRDSL